MLAFSETYADDDSWPDEVTRHVKLLGSLEHGPVVAVLDTMPLFDLAALLTDQRVSAIVIVDETRALRGLVTRTDVILALVQGVAATAADVMSTLVFALGEDATIECAAALMAVEEVGQIVVTGECGELVAVVSALDIARHVAVAAGYLRVR